MPSRAEYEKSFTADLLNFVRTEYPEEVIRYLEQRMNGAMDDEELAKRIVRHPMVTLRDAYNYFDRITMSVSRTLEKRDRIEDAENAILMGAVLLLLTLHDLRNWKRESGWGRKSMNWKLKCLLKKLKREEYRKRYLDRREYFASYWRLRRDKERGNASASTTIDTQSDGTKTA